MVPFEMVSCAHGLKANGREFEAQAELNSTRCPTAGRACIDRGKGLREGYRCSSYCGLIRGDLSWHRECRCIDPPAAGGTGSTLGRGQANPRNEIGPKIRLAGFVVGVVAVQNLRLWLVENDIDRKAGPEGVDGVDGDAAKKISDGAVIEEVLSTPHGQGVNRVCQNNVPRILIVRSVFTVQTLIVVGVVAFPSAGRAVI
ncbi:MAG: hypothetical protein JWQ49_4401 [Edaphobacter sp.]|nr:hypothetical protein [Edaphobacter sp.]